MPNSSLPSPVSRRGHAPLVFPRMRRGSWARLRLGPSVPGQCRWRRREHGTIRSRRKQPHFRAKAKRVIYLFMAGAPSHLELFDYKPQLAKYDGTLPPAELLKGYRAAFINPNSKLLGPEIQIRQARPVRRRAFRTAAAPGRGRRRHRHRQVDAHRRVQSRAGPDLHEHRLAAVRPAEHGRVGDSTASGSESQRSARLRRASARAAKGPAAARRTGAAAFCPPSIRACRSAARGDPILYLSNPPGVDRQVQRDSLDTHQAAQSECASTSSAIPKSPRASIRSKWRTACKPARRS